MISDEKSRQQLIDLLHEAAQVEHTLLCSYLYAACSLKSLPDEFLLEGRENPRRAIQFETVRAWKNSILSAAREEMRHLHYVQCLLRTLNEPPCFQLAPRNVAGNWIFSNWRERIFTGGEKGTAEVEIPLEPLDLDTAKRFVLYESGDWLQDADPFGGEIQGLLQRLYRFERELKIHQLVGSLPDADLRAKLIPQLHLLYGVNTPLPQATGDSPSPPAYEDVENSSGNPRFTSIADLYLDGIVPLFDEAFALGWVVRTDGLLVNELQEAVGGSVSPDPASRGSLFRRVVASSFSDPIRSFADVERIINEIVVEGEGVTNFASRAQTMLDYIEQHGGPAFYSRMTAQFNAPIPTLPGSGQLVSLIPIEIDAAELLRNSHIYRFAMILIALRQEAVQAEAATPGSGFEPAREPIEVGDNIVLRQLTDELPKQFNACYLVLTTWLSRLYEIANWTEDAPRRKAIEALTTWPLMSMAIRPFLELASFLPIDLTHMFRQEAEALPALPVFATQLCELVETGDRSQPVADRMDLLAVRVLSSIAGWAGRIKRAIDDINLPDMQKKCIARRLELLSHLDEFDPQFDFRKAGGFSNTLPDRTYMKNHPGGKEYAEDPFSTTDPDNGPTPLFQNTAILRLRFSGWALLQMASDFDAPSDEAGCTGSVFLHPSDGSKILNRALLWQADGVKEAILREPRSVLPEIGVNLVEATLMVTDGAAFAGYQSFNHPQKAINPIQQPRHAAVTGLLELSTLSAAAVSADRTIQFNLAPNAGQFPRHIGLNHVVWQDGEAIDPFILAVQASGGSDGRPELLFQREVANGGKSFLEFSPLQRAYSARWVVGRAQPFLPPSWVPQPQLDGVQNGAAFLSKRVTTLGTELSALLASGSTTQATMDTAVSFAERIPLALPWKIANSGHYGHTISGNITSANTENVLFSAFATHNNAPLLLPNIIPRTTVNGRWLASYALGALDLDALACFVYGEVWIPVNVQANDAPLRFHRKWVFPSGMGALVTAFACRFDQPFWGTYQVDGTKRTATMNGLTITETLQAQTATSYTCTLEGIAGIDFFEATLAVEDSPAETALVYTVRFHGAAGSLVAAMRFTGNTFEAIAGALAAHFNLRG